MMNTLLNLFVAQLQDAYSAETQIVRSMPKLIQAASSEELKEGLRDHLEETRSQVQKLEEIGQRINYPVTGETCESMQGILREADEMVALSADPNVKDAGLIAAAQKVEHYEIALYGCLATWAGELSLNDVQHELHQILEEEKRADADLTALAEARVNAMARQ